MPFINVTVKGTKRGTTADFDENCSIDADSGATFTVNSEDLERV